MRLAQAAGRDPAADEAGAAANGAAVETDPELWEIDEGGRAAINNRAATYKPVSARL